MNGERNMNTIVSIRDLVDTQPFDVDSEYKSIDSILDKTINVLETKFFENDKGEGAFILCDDGHDIFHLCTHSVGLIGVLKNEKVQEMIGQGQPLQARIVKRKSTKSDRMVYSFA